MSEADAEHNITAMQALALRVEAEGWTPEVAAAFDAQSCLYVQCTECAMDKYCPSPKRDHHVPK